MREVVEDGIHIVAGAGNALTSDRDVFCPAKIPETVSVGTYEVVCGSEVDTPPNAPPGFSRDIAPPGSYTIPTSNSPTADWVPDKNYCGGVGCSAMEDCDVNRREQLWAGNPQQNSGPIDVFAPGTVVVGNEEQIEMAIGSSYSTAVVSGSLAHVFGALHQTQPIPDPDDVTTAISGLRQTVGSSVQRKLDVTELKNTLQRH